MTVIKKIIIFTILMFCMQHAYAKSENSQKILILGFDGQRWFPYVAMIKSNRTIKSKDWNRIKAIRNPVAVTQFVSSNDLYVKADDGGIYGYQAKNKSLLPLGDLTQNKNKYTQLRAADDGLLMVELAEGKSRETELVVYTQVSVDKKDTAFVTQTIHKQASAQFHPYQHQDTLFFAHVSCRAPCQPIIQEVWQHNRITGLSKQLTLLNATSYLHSVSADGHSAYISSNQPGYYNIARLDLNSNKLTWLTRGQFTDSFPSVATDNHVYFIRRTTDGTHLMRLDDRDKNTATSTPQEIELPKGVKKIRYLEISQ